MRAAAAAWPYETGAGQQALPARRWSHWALSRVGTHGQGGRAWWLQRKRARMAMRGGAVEETDACDGCGSISTRDSKPRSARACASECGLRGACAPVCQRLRVSKACRALLLHACTQMHAGAHLKTATPARLARRQRRTGAGQRYTAEHHAWCRRSTWRQLQPTGLCGSRVSRWRPAEAAKHTHVLRRTARAGRCQTAARAEQCGGRRPSHRNTWRCGNSVSSSTFSDTIQYAQHARSDAALLRLPLL